LNVAINPIDDAIATVDQLANVRTTELGDDATCHWKRRNALGLIEQAFDDETSVVRRVAFYETLDGRQILSGALGPPK